MSPLSAVQDISNEIENSRAQQLIVSFADADRELLQHIHDANHHAVAELGRRTDELLNQLVEFDTSDKKQMKMVLRFLMERFVIPENSGPELRQRIVMKALAQV